MEKLTEYELLKRLDNEFYDVDFSVRDCATKGVVATVYFYEDKFSISIFYSFLCWGPCINFWFKAQSKINIFKKSIFRAQGLSI